MTVRGRRKEGRYCAGLVRKGLREFMEFQLAHERHEDAERGSRSRTLGQEYSGNRVKRGEVQGEQGVPWRLVGQGGRGWFRPCAVGPSISFFPSCFMHIHMYMNSVRCDKPSRHFSERFLLDTLNI